MARSPYAGRARPSARTADFAPESYATRPETATTTGARRPSFRLHAERVEAPRRRAAGSGRRDERDAHAAVPRRQVVALDLAAHVRPPRALRRGSDGEAEPVATRGRHAESQSRAARRVDRGDGLDRVLRAAPHDR